MSEGKTKLREIVKATGIERYSISVLHEKLIVINDYWKVLHVVIAQRNLEKAYSFENKRKFHCNQDNVHPCAVSIGKMMILKF